MELRRVLSWLFAPLPAHRKTLLAMNLAYLAAFALGVAYTLINRQAQPTLLAAVQQGLAPSGSLGPVVRAYQSGDLGAAFILTFAVNLLLATMITITLPSLIIPFAGIAMGVL